MKNEPIQGVSRITGISTQMHFTFFIFHF